MNATVTAVGRRLRPRNGEPQRYHVIAVSPSGQVRAVIDRVLQPET